VNTDGFGVEWCWLASSQDPVAAVQCVYCPYTKSFALQADGLGMAYNILHRLLSIKMVFCTFKHKDMH